ncbi:MAG: hypothetical protein C0606_07270 [Hyphomicrobiales bacterium]|mgnify:CR=1 FL=1|nr:MAG: hypothetical protein C0606_07270 [Hyphomicrobiales bacterium]
MRRSILIILSCGLALGACSRLGFDSRSYVSPLPAAPTTPVQSSQLAPVDLTNGQDAEQPMTDPLADGEQPPVDGEAQVAAAQPMAEPASSVEVGRTDLLGGWTVASGSDSCQLFMTLTTWTGGYRATTRGCGSDTLKNVAAWDLNGKQVILKDGGGANVALLYGTASEKFNGQTTVGQPISIFR